MKVSRLLILISICSNLNLYAAETDDPNKCITYSTDSKSQRDKMCDCTKEFLTELDKDPKINFDEEKAKLTKLKSKVNIINDINKLVSNYKNDLVNIASPTQSPNLEKKLIEYKKAISDATLINAINNFVTKNKALVEEKDFNLDKLCAQKNHESDYGFICDYKAKEDHWYKKSYIDTFKRFIDTYKQANADGKDVDLDAKIKSIINEIPADVSADFVSKLESTFSPNLQKVMNEAVGNLENSCKTQTGDAKAACVPSFLNFKETDNTKVTDELNKISQQFAQSSATQLDKKAIFNNKLQDYLSKQINDNYNNFTSTRKSEIDNAFNKYKNFPYGDLMNLGGRMEKEFKNDYGLKDKLSNFHDKCFFEGKDTSKLSEIEKVNKMNECNDLIQKISDTLKNDDIKNLNNEYADAQKSFLDKMNGPEVRENNKVKNFIANNYMRNCNQNNSSAQLVNGCPNDTLSPITNFKLANTTFDIIGKISSESMTEDSAFSTEELNDIKNICMKKRDNYKLTCKIVDQEYQMAKGQKTTQDWKDLNEKYWVKYDAKSRSGYTLTEKKSWARMLGEAAVPAFTNNVGYWMYNYQQSYVVDQMQQQALLQKQWMWDYNQAQTYWMANYFNTSTTSSTSSTTFTSTNSYNFGN